MKLNRPKLATLALLAVLTAVAVPQTIHAQQSWNALVGAQSKDMAKQAIAFLPNELWIHAGDSITWTSASGDIHTVSFLIAGQPYADFTVGCPGYSPSGSSFDGTACVTAPPLVQGQSFTVMFPEPGNFQLVCLVHTHMTGVVHVLDPSAVLPHDQVFYNRQAAEYKRDLLNDADNDKGQGHTMQDMLSTRVLPGKGVAAGIGEMAATGAGFQSLSVVRFLHPAIQIRAGQTVEWTNLDPAMPHTVTFGTEPDNPGPPSANVTMDADGALHATIISPADNVHSGIIVAAPQDQLGVPQSPPGTTRFRITFKHPGTYNYKCELHDNLGMVGKVIVLP